MVTREDFDECNSFFEASDDSKAVSVTSGQKRRRSILNDIKRMFPEKSSYPINDADFISSLQQILEALCNYQPELSYVQGMSYIAAMLLSHMEIHGAFICLVNMLKKDFFSPYTSFNVGVLRKKFRVCLAFCEMSFSDNSFRFSTSCSNTISQICSSSFSSLRFAQTVIS
jgi:hypothetical protein